LLLCEQRSLLRPHPLLQRGAELVGAIVQRLLLSVGDVLEITDATLAVEDAGVELAARFDGSQKLHAVEWRDQRTKGTELERATDHLQMLVLAQDERRRPVRVQ